MQKNKLKRALIIAIVLFGIIADIVYLDYCRAKSGRNRAIEVAKLMESEERIERIDFKPGEAIIHYKKPENKIVRHSKSGKKLKKKKSKAIYLGTLDRIESAGPHAEKLIFRSPLFGFEMTLICSPQSE